MSLARTIAPSALRCVDVRLPVAMALALLFESVARLTRRKPRITRELLRGFTSTRAFNTSKARRELGFHPEIRLDEGIRTTVKGNTSKGYL